MVSSINDKRENNYYMHYKTKHLLHIFIALARIPYRLLNEAKKLYYTNKIKIQCGGYEGRVTVNAKSTVTKTTFFKDNIHFNGMEIGGGGKVTIGRNFHSGKNCMMITQDHKYDHGNAIPYDTDLYIFKNIDIEDNVWIGSNVIILGGAIIREGAIIQAGSVVVGEIPPYTICGGHPAKQFKTRNLESYKELKRLERFN